MTEQKWADLLESLPTIQEGQTCNLKVDNGWLRVSLSRCAMADGEPFDRTVYVETLVGAMGRMTVWKMVGYFDGDEPDPVPVGLMMDAWQETLDAVAKHAHS